MADNRPALVANGALSVNGTAAMPRCRDKGEDTKRQEDCQFVRRKAALAVLRCAETGSATAEEVGTPDEQIAAVLTRLGPEVAIEPEPVTLSGGQIKCMRLTASTFESPDFLLLDEQPTSRHKAHGGAQSRCLVRAVGPMSETTSPGPSSKFKPWGNVGLAVPVEWHETLQ